MAVQKTASLGVDASVFLLLLADDNIQVLHFPGHCPPWQADYSNSDSFVLLSRTASIESFAQSRVLIKKRNEFGLKLTEVILGKIYRHKEANPCKGCSHLFVMPSQLSKKNGCLQLC